MDDVEAPGEFLDPPSNESPYEVDDNIAMRASAAPGSALPAVVVPSAVSTTRPPRPSSRSSKAVVDLNPQLTALAVAAAKDAANSGESKITKRKSDFNSLYTVTKQKD